MQAVDNINLNFIGILATFIFFLIGRHFGKIEARTINAELKNANNTISSLRGKIEELAKSEEIISPSAELAATESLFHIVRDEENFYPNYIVAITPGGGRVTEWLSYFFRGKNKKPLPILSINLNQEKGDSGLPTGKAQILDRSAWKSMCMVKMCENDKVNCTKCNDYLPATNFFANSQLKLIVVTDVLRSGTTLKVVKNFFLNVLNIQEKNIKFCSLFVQKNASYNEGITLHSHPRSKKHITFKWKNDAKFIGKMKDEKQE